MGFFREMLVGPLSDMKDCAQEMVGIDPDAKLRRIPQAAQSAAIRAGYSSTSEIVYYYNHIWRR